jgi:hypothetical protein
MNGKQERSGRPCGKSGRQDLNLRPPGPQPSRCSISQWQRPVFTGFSPAESPSISLKLDPKLEREHMFDTVSNVVAVDERFGGSPHRREASTGK